MSDLVAKENMLSYEEIMASTPPIDLDIAIPKASALKHLKPITFTKQCNVVTKATLSFIDGSEIIIPANCIFGISATLNWANSPPIFIMISTNSPPNLSNPSSYASAKSADDSSIKEGSLGCSLTSYTNTEKKYYLWGKSSNESENNIVINYWYIKL